MYTDLLTRALGNGEEGQRSDDLLLADLLQSRARLHDGRGTIPVAEALAREVSYDGALVRLCRSLGVATAPGRFANPPRERARLEHALSQHHSALSSGVAELLLQPA